MKITVKDRSSYEVTARAFTREGFLKVPARVARTGIQEYLASELGVKGPNEADRIIKVYRPEAEVFKDASLNSFLGADVTNDHPTDLVNSNTFSSVSKGVVTSCGRRDGDFVVCDLIIKDQAAIEDVISGKVQISAGYTAEYIEENGVTDCGQKYDFYQKDICINHVALVRRGRAGAQAKLFDTECNNMDKKETLANVQDKQPEDKKEKEQEQQAQQKLKSEAVKPESEAAQNTNKKSTDGLSKKITDGLSAEQQLKDTVKTILDSINKAKELAGSQFTTDSVNTSEIQVESIVSTGLFGKSDFEGKSVDYIQGAFDAAIKNKENQVKEQVRKALDEEANKGVEAQSSVNDSHKGLAKDGQGLAPKASNDSKKPVLSAYEKLKITRQNAWMSK